MKKFSELLNEVKTAPAPNVAETIRESYVNGEIYNIGELVKCDKGIAEIINRGPNYVTLVQEGRIFKRWITDISETTTQSTKKAHVVKESFIVSGYKTQNFTHELAEAFSEVSKSSQDKFALFNCAVCCDRLLGASDSELIENFEKYRVDFERASKYLAKFNIQIDEMCSIEDRLFAHALTEGLKFSASDKMKVAHIIAKAVGHKPATEHKDPVDIVHGAVDHVKKNRYSEQQWKILGGMLNKATEAGIKWDKNKFHSRTQHFMGLK